jgi:hypothetical protein
MGLTEFHSISTRVLQTEWLEYVFSVHIGYLVLQDPIPRWASRCLALHHWEWVGRAFLGFWPCRSKRVVSRNYGTDNEGFSDTFFWDKAVFCSLGYIFFHHPESQNPSLNSKVKLHHLRMRTKYKSCWGSDKSWNPLCTFSNLKHWVAFHEAFKNRMGNTRTGSDCEGKPFGLLKL